MLHVLYVGMYMYIVMIIGYYVSIYHTMLKNLYQTEM